ncbi:hypothetical protein BDZ90DRAFT_232585 [Jaminaea rosea]|uniref:Uncharacterized protein n=1 Tax=Jaminaea rosea TaxID=1569628 RepID=A0A316UQD7_9BASI|nr:hypothetical protein BDZ90DRAFT_232585 [Jaminaea rosea]PWN27008.1 hypothetical protein BDZ90DRAFT_232585 [Jaminaea rosea]
MAPDRCQRSKSQPARRIGHGDLTRAQSVAPTSSRTAARWLVEVKPEPREERLPSKGPPATPTSSSTALVLWQGPTNVTTPSAEQGSRSCRTPTPSPRRAQLFPWMGRQPTPSPTFSKRYHRGMPNNQSWTRHQISATPTPGQHSQHRAPSSTPDARQQRAPSSSSTRLTTPGASFLGGDGGDGGGSSSGTAIEVDEEVEDDSDSGDDSPTPTAHRSRDTRAEARSSRTAPPGVQLVISASVRLAWDCTSTNRIRDTYAIPINVRVSLPQNADLSHARDNVESLVRHGAIERELSLKLRTLVGRAFDNART